MYKNLLILMIFVLGLNFCLQNKNKNIEGFSSSNCPNILIKENNHFLLKNTKKREVPGVNPITFNSLEEYNEFVEWQRANGINCPVLYLEQTYDTQGDISYKMKSDPNDKTNNGIGQLPGEFTKLYDAGRSDDTPYNKNSYPSFDAYNQYIGILTPLDDVPKPILKNTDNILFQQDENKKKNTIP